MLHFKGHECSVQKKIAPTESDLDLIQAYAPEPIDPAKLFVGRMSLANDQYDRSHERFPVEYLRRFAETIPGKGVMTGHDYRKEPAGTFFGGEVQERGGRQELITRYYLLDGSELAEKVKAGIARSVSIGFNPDKRLCDLDGKDYDGWWSGEEDACEHIAGREYDGERCTLTYGGDLAKVEAVEGSFVWLGCQYGAEALGGNGALSPRAKTAYFESRQQKGIWQISSAPLVTAGSVNVTGRIEPFFPLSEIGPNGYPVPASSKEKAMPPDVEKGTPPPTEAKLSAEQDRWIALGKAYIEFAQGHVKSRYGACEQEGTGDLIAATLETAPLETIQKAIESADQLFNKHFPGTGKGVPMSDEPPVEVPPRRFNPFRSALPGRS